MENDVFERDYTLSDEEQRESEELWNSIAANLKSSAPMQQYLSEMRALPKAIVPEYRADYEYLLNLCDDLARSFNGAVRGVVDYQKWSASIDLIVPFIEFASDDELLRLREISEKAHTVTISCADESGIRIHIYNDYFEDLVSDGKRTYIEFETIMQDTELLELFGQSAGFTTEDVEGCKHRMDALLECLEANTGRSREDIFLELFSLMDDREALRATLKKYLGESGSSFPFL